MAGDVVILKTDEPRNNWPMAIITKVTPDETGVVRKVKIRFSNDGILERPISKLVLLKEVECNDSPPKEPSYQDLECKS